MLDDVKTQALKRLAYISGHVDGIRRMVEADTYCVDVLKQTHAVRRALEKFEALLLEGHLRSCVVEGLREGREEQVVGELMDLYGVKER
ncbi:MAG: metal-sensitive transcriptional regulator [Chloroflexota bacterium]